MAKGFIGASGCKAYLGAVKMRTGYIGAAKVYSAGNIVTYHVDTGITYQEEVDEGASCLSPKTFTPAKSGWTFAGWRQGTAADGSVLSNLVMGNASMTLYAVFRQTVTLTYNGNSATSGSTAAQTGYRYYNNGNVTNPAFTLRANGFSRTGYTFSKWALGSAGGTQYTAGASVTLAANATMYAVWTAAAHYFTPLNGAAWTITEEYGVNEKLTVSSNSIALTCQKPEGTVTHGKITAKATIPTGGCTKVRFTAAVGIWSSFTINCNGAEKTISTQSSSINNNFDFNISGNNIVVYLKLSSGTEYYTATATLTNIYFYN